MDKSNTHITSSEHVSFTTSSTTSLLIHGIVTNGGLKEIETLIFQVSDILF